MLFTLTTPVVAVFDTCILFPNILRDTLFRSHRAGICQGHLTADILLELERNLVAKKAVKDAESARYLIRTIRGNLEEMLVTGYEAHIPHLTCDPKDRHVLAAAIQANASIIVTVNHKDFPPASLIPHDVVTQSPDAFLLDLFERDCEGMAKVITKQSRALWRKPMSVPEVLHGLHQHAPRFVAALFLTMWASNELPLDRHTRNLYTTLQHADPDFSVMDPTTEHLLWAGYDREPDTAKPDTAKPDLSADPAEAADSAHAGADTTAADETRP